MKTFCNPLPLPDYPVGLYAKRGLHDGWINKGTPCSFRETADLSVIFEDGKWYLYASGGKMWFSDDLVKWTAADLPELDYAPSAVKHRGKYYLTASNSPLYVSCSPVGPWEKLGVMLDMDGKPYPGAMRELLVDVSGNRTDLLIDYRTFETKRIQFARLRVLGGPRGMAVGLSDLTLFGKGTPIPPDAPYGKWDQ